ncbi:MAG: transglutaminase-like domain-containing protein, partial [Firmicutes bacterium]|nr:transglutaminase-like domain-containing protein [Bacillota bacterium]
AGINTYLGYDSLLRLSTPTRLENEVRGSFNVAGWSHYRSVAVISAREDSKLPRYTLLSTDNDGQFNGVVWLTDGPGRYTVNVAILVPGDPTYKIVCAFNVTNTSRETPLCPIEYKGYGTDLVIHSPRGPSNVVTDSITIYGWSQYRRVQATVQNLATGEMRVYYAFTNEEGLFDLPLPLDVGSGECEIKIASRQTGENTWRGAAVYRVVVEPPPIHVTEPAYQFGTIFATGRFRMAGTALSKVVRLDLSPYEPEHSPPLRSTEIRVDTSTGSWEAWVDPPTAVESFRVSVASVDEKTGAPVSPRSYAVRMVKPRPEPSKAEKWVAQSVYQSIQKASRDILAGISDRYAATMAVHDWVAKNIAYDVAGFRNRSPGPTDALSTLAKRESICLGYSNLTAALLRAAGIPVWVVVGMVDIGDHLMKHAWNEVEVNGRIVLLDTTWDSGYSDGPKFVRRFTRQYYDPSPELFSVTHIQGIDNS